MGCMPTFIGFLRAVNVGKRQYPMAELRAVLEKAGFTDVATHIQTGNVRVTTSMRSTDKVSAALEEAFEADRSFAVPTVVLTPKELAQVAADADDVADRVPTHGHYVELMRHAPDAAGKKLIEGQDYPGQRFVVRGRAVHLLFDVGFGTAKPATAAVKRAMGDSTNRNVKVLRALVEKWC